MSPTSPARIVLATLLVLALAIPACAPHSPTAPAPPAPAGALALEPYAGDPELQPAGPPGADLTTVWPSTDLFAWTYEMTAHDIGDFDPQLYPAAAMVPAITLDLASALLATPPDAPVPVPVDDFRLRFDGLGTTQSGVTGQNLEWSLVTAAGQVTRLPDAAAAFRARLAAVRPDLRARLGAPNARAAGGSPRPRLLFGAIWERTDDHIGTYGDLDTQLAWKFHEANLEPGHEFVHPLVPSIASDVRLLARVLPRATVVTPNGTFGKTVRVLYVVDYGIAAEIDPGGHLLGYYRAFDYGIVAYAPGYGPVADHERQLGSVGSPPTLGAFAVALELRERSFDLAARRPIARRF